MKNHKLYFKVYEILREIPRGKVTTYGIIAEYLGNKKMARVVGNILHVNPDGQKYPCYKVVNSKGRLAENFGLGGIEVQRARLEAEGIKVENYRVDLSKYLWDGPAENTKGNSKSGGL